jgi:cell division septation protein DedD
MKNLALLAVFAVASVSLVIGVQAPSRASALVLPSINVVEYCVDGSAFRFTVDLMDVPVVPGTDVVNFDIGADGNPFVSPVEVFLANFAPSDGTITAGPLVSTAGTPLFDRWQAEGPVADFTLTSLGGGAWRLEGGMLHGTQPFSPGDDVADTALRVFGDSFPDIHELDVPVTACEFEPTPTPTPTSTPTPTPTPTATPAPPATPTPTATPTVLAATATPAPTPTPEPSPAVLPASGGAPPDGSSGGLPWLAAIAGAIAVMAASGSWFAYQRRRVR